MRWTAAIILQLCCVVGRAASPSASAPLLSAHHMVVPPPETEGGPPHVVVARTLSPNKRTMSPAALPGFGPPRTVDVRAWYGAISANSGAGVYWENEGDRGEEGAGSRETKECAQPLEKQEAPRRKPRKKVHRRRWSGGPWVMYQCAGYGSRSGAECRGNVTHGVAGHAGEHWNAFLCDVCSRGVPDAVYLRRRCMQCPREASCGAPGAAIKTARHCAWHKGPNESDLRHLRCRHAEGCERRAQYGEMPHASEKPMPVFCGAHRLPHHRDVKHRMCAEIDCHKRALFGSNSTGMRFCAKHKDDDDINLSRLPGLRAGSKPRRARSRSSGASVLSADA